MAHAAETIVSKLKFLLKKRHITLNMPLETALHIFAQDHAEEFRCSLCKAAKCPPPLALLRTKTGLYRRRAMEQSW
jgi:hypothetical protein